METYIDRLLAAVRRAGPETVPEVQAAVRDIRCLSSPHFEKEEAVFYPSLRPAFPDLLARMDRQHEEVREVERLIGELLSDPPPTPESRWLNELRLFGTELLVGFIARLRPSRFPDSDARKLSSPTNNYLSGSFPHWWSTPLRRTEKSRLTGAQQHQPRLRAGLPYDRARLA
jgi:hypothetical protein